VLAALAPHFNVFLQIIQPPSEAVGEPFAAENCPGRSFGHRISDVAQKARFDCITVGLSEYEITGLRANF